MYVSPINNNHYNNVVNFRTLNFKSNALKIVSKSYEPVYNNFQTLQNIFRAMQTKDAPSELKTAFTELMNKFRIISVNKDSDKGIAFMLDETTRKKYNLNNILAISLHDIEGQTKTIRFLDFSNKEDLKNQKPDKSLCACNKKLVKSDTKQGVDLSNIKYYEEDEYSAKAAAKGFIFRLTVINNLFNRINQELEQNGLTEKVNNYLSSIADTSPSHNATVVQYKFDHLRPKKKEEEEKPVVTNPSTKEHPAAQPVATKETPIIDPNGTTSQRVVAKKEEPAQVAIGTNDGKSHEKTPLNTLNQEEQQKTIIENSTPQEQTIDTTTETSPTAIKVIKRKGRKPLKDIPGIVPDKIQKIFDEIVALYYELDKGLTNSTNDSKHIYRKKGKLDSLGPGTQGTKMLTLNIEGKPEETVRLNVRRYDPRTNASPIPVISIVDQEGHITYYSLRSKQLMKLPPIKLRLRSDKSEDDTRYYTQEEINSIDINEYFVPVRDALKKSLQELRENNQVKTRKDLKSEGASAGEENKPAVKAAVAEQNVEPGNIHDKLDDLKTIKELHNLLYEKLRKLQFNKRYDFRREYGIYTIDNFINSIIIENLGDYKERIRLTCRIKDKKDNIIIYKLNEENNTIDKPLYILGDKLVKGKSTTNKEEFLYYSQEDIDNLKVADYIDEIKSRLAEALVKSEEAKKKPAVETATPEEKADTGVITTKENHTNIKRGTNTTQPNDNLAVLNQRLHELTMLIQNTLSEISKKYTEFGSIVNALRNWDNSANALIKSALDEIDKINLEIQKMLNQKQ